MGARGSETIAFACLYETRGKESQVPIVISPRKNQKMQLKVSLKKKNIF
jgi:hypothetical protein